MAGLQFYNGKLFFSSSGKLVMGGDCCCGGGECENCTGDFNGIKVTASFSNDTCTSCSDFDITDLECPQDASDACCGYGTETEFSGDCRGYTYDHCYTYVSWSLVKDDQATPHYWIIIEMGTVYDTADIPYEIYVLDLGSSMPDCTSTTVRSAAKVTDCSTQYPSGTFSLCTSDCDRRDGNCAFPSSISWKFY